MLFPGRCAAALSAKIRQGLLNIKMIDSFGKVLEEPRWAMPLCESVVSDGMRGFGCMRCARQMEGCLLHEP